jgi:hypothetical protein
VTASTQPPALYSSRATTVKSLREKRSRTQISGCCYTGCTSSVFTAGTQPPVLWDMILQHWESRSQHFELVCCLHTQRFMVSHWTTENDGDMTLRTADSCPVVKCHIPDDWSPLLHCCEHLKGEWMPHSTGTLLASQWRTQDLGTPLWQAHWTVLISAIYSGTKWVPDCGGRDGYHSYHFDMADCPTVPS